MFKNDRMMLILTGLVLAIFAGSMVQYGDRIMALMSGEKAVATQDDSYSVRAGASQILDVLSNDIVKGPIVVLTRPSCGAVEMTSNNRLSFSSDESCNGEVEFAYCVDADGKCEPNAVKINVISVSFAQTNTPESNTAAETAPVEQAQNDPVPAPSGATPNTPQSNTAAGTVPVEQAQNNPVPAPSGATPPAPPPQAPAIASFSVEMSPPSLAAPSVPELVSPSMALASIRRSAGGLDTASTTDQTIATQNSASINQSATPEPSAFSAPEIGGASNISLGGAERVVASGVAPPTGLQATSNGDSNIVQLERGPEALVTLQIAQTAPADADQPPLAANPEINGAAPVFVASAQTSGPSPDSKFSAQPVGGGPIALIALNRTATRGNGAGESLNLILTEPGLQSFQSPAHAPSALAPASARPSSVSVMERGPNVAETLDMPQALAFETAHNVSSSTPSDPLIARAPLVKPVANAADAPFSTAGIRVVAAQPVQSSAPAPFMRHDSISRFISISQNIGQHNRVASITGLSTPSALAFSRPQINLTPAQPPQILEASLPVAPEAPVTTAPAQNSACEIALSTRVRSGANIALDIAAGCKPNQMVTIEHSGIAFSVLTDDAGAASVLVPAMEAQAEINVKFEDQSANSTVVSVADIDKVVRVGVSWQANMNLDLNAIEFGAAIGSEGYVTPATPRDYRSSRVKGGGYLLVLGDPDLVRGALAEVYTLPTTRNQQRGTVAMSIVISDVAPVCGQTISAKTVRTREDRSAGIRNVRFTVPSCDTIVSGPIALPGAIDDIRLAGR